MRWHFAHLWSIYSESDEVVEWTGQLYYYKVNGKVALFSGDGLRTSEDW
jgi:hypothetical protein